MRITSLLPWNTAPVKRRSVFAPGPMDMLVVDLASLKEEGFDLLRQLQEAPPPTFTLVMALAGADKKADKLRAFDSRRVGLHEPAV